MQELKTEFERSQENLNSIEEKMKFCINIFEEIEEKTGMKLLNKRVDENDI